MYSGSHTEEVCTKCGDSNIDVKELSKTKINTYLGCPPFPEEEKKKEMSNPDTYYWTNGD